MEEFRPVGGFVNYKITGAEFAASGKTFVHGKDRTGQSNGLRRQQRETTSRERRAKVKNARL